MSGPFRAWRVIAEVWTSSSRAVRRITYYDRDQAMAACDALLAFNVATETKVRVVGLRNPKPEARPATETMSLVALADLLSLVMSPWPDAAWLDTLSDAQRSEIKDWAGAEHLAASDNDVERTPMPAVLDDWHNAETERLRVEAESR